MIRQNNIISIFGRKGSGKSILLKSAVKNCRRLLLIDPMSEYNNGYVTYDLNDMLNKIEREYFRIIFRPLSEDDYNNAIYAALAVKNMTLAIDEIDLYCNSYYMSEPLRYCIQYGRHFNISIIAVSRQPNRVRGDITSQSDFILSFETHGYNDKKYLQSFAGDDIRGLISNLQQHNFINVAGDFSLDFFDALP